MRLWVVVLSTCALIFAGQTLVGPLHQSIGAEESSELLSFLSLCLGASYCGGFLSGGYIRWRFLLTALFALAALTLPLFLGAEGSLLPLAALCFSGTAGLLFSALLTLSSRGAFAASLLAFPFVFSSTLEGISALTVLAVAAPLILLPALIFGEGPSSEESPLLFTQDETIAPVTARASVALRLTRATLLGSAAWFLCLGTLGAEAIELFPDSDLSLRPELLFGLSAFLGATISASPREWSPRMRSLLGLFAIAFALLIAGESPFATLPLMLQSIGFGYALANIPLFKGRWQPRVLVILLPFTILILSLNLPLSSLMIYQLMLVSCAAVTLSLLVEGSEKTVTLPALARTNTFEH
ncbi:MAG: hypothetical protein VYD19_03500 [Myxococcota bacterium]|nr:hypothetical protein [Myxococcota bacterium]